MSSRKTILKAAIFLAVLGLLLLSVPAVYAGCGGAGCGVQKTCPAECTKECCRAKTAPAGIDTPALKTLINAKVSMTLLDARGAQKSWIPSATPLAVSATQEQILKTVPSKDTLVVTYCGGPQCPLSSMLAKRLTDLGYRNVLEYHEGVKGWVASGGKLETAGS